VTTVLKFTCQIARMGLIASLIILFDSFVITERTIKQV